MSALLTALPARENYAIHADGSHGSSIRIFAPHGGCIEPCTEPVALALAKDRYDSYVFSGRRSGGCFATLHVTSTHYDEPRCLALASGAELAVAIHGCEGKEEAIYVGGGNTDLSVLLMARLIADGFPAEAAPGSMGGEDPRNFINRARQKGIQLELSAGFRKRLFPSFPKTLQRDPLLGQFVETVRVWLAWAERELAGPSRA